MKSGQSKIQVIMTDELGNEFTRPSRADAAKYLHTYDTKIVKSEQTGRPIEWNGHFYTIKFETKPAVVPNCNWYCPVCQQIYNWANQYEHFKSQKHMRNLQANQHLSHIKCITLSSDEVSQVIQYKGGKAILSIKPLPSSK